MLTQKTVTYQYAQKNFQGHFFYDDNISTPLPVVIVAHAWRGQDDFAREKAWQLAQMGYVGFAADLYGDAKSVSTNEEAQELMIPLFLDRTELRGRIVAAFNTAQKFEKADPSKVGAIGFCFGGLTVIELLRSGVDVNGVVSFHGLLGYEMGNLKAEKPPQATNMKGSLLILHGHDDPLVSPAHVKDIQDEMTQAKVRWEMDIYGLTKHAFTNPVATDPSTPFLYNESVAKTAWQRMTNFFQNLF